jgi:hypothetical protein
MKTIEIDDEVYKFLLSHVESFGETPNDVLRRILKLNSPVQQITISPIPTTSPQNIPASSSLFGPSKNIEKSKWHHTRGAIPSKEYRLPILEALIELGGRATRKEVLYIVERKMKPRFTHIDVELIESGTSVRWRKNAEWEKYKMVKEGLLRSDSPAGIWEITDEGKVYYYNAKQNP